MYTKELNAHYSNKQTLVPDAVCMVMNQYILKRNDSNWPKAEDRPFLVCLYCLG